MYTLREAGYITDGASQVYVDFYIQNLSNDKDKAIEKAKVISTEIGLDFHADGELFALNEIKRLRKEEREMIERVARIEQEKRDYEAAVVFDAQVTDGNFVSGKYTGLSPTEVVEGKDDLQYIKWYAGQYVEGAKTKFNVNAYIAKRYVENNQVPESQFVGNVGENVTVTGKVRFSRLQESFYGMTRKVIIESDANVITIYSTSKAVNALEVGDKVEITGKVKKHDEWSNEKTTQLGGRLKVKTFEAV